MSPRSTAKTKANPARKSSAKSSVRKPKRPSVPQPHGGALVPGAGGGRQPGAGRPPDEVRKALAGSFAERQATLEKFADDQKLDPATRMKALEVLARYGLGTANSLSLSTIDRAWVVTQLAGVRRIVREMLPPAQADALLERIATETFVHE